MRKIILPFFVEKNKNISKRDAPGFKSVKKAAFPRQNSFFF